MTGRRICAIADDVTGATDVAVALRRAGLSVRIAFGVPTSPGSPEDAGSDALVIALKTRTIAAAEAVDQSLQGVRWARALGYDRFYFKYCSTFDSTPRGNIGPVADALADELDSPMTVVTPASPVHGRTVYRGHLFVGDVLLSDSPMRTHPLTPMTDANLVRVLSAQTPRRVALLRLEVVRRGASAIAAELDRLAADGARYAVVDATEDADLAELGRAVQGVRLVTGAAGLAGGLASALIERPRSSPEGPVVVAAEQPYQPHVDSRAPTGRAAVLAGSCSARTLEQVAAMAEGNPSWRLDALAGLDAAALAESALAFFDALPPGRVPLIYSSLPPDALAEVQDRLGAAAAADLLEEATGLIAKGLVERGVRRLVLAGGETSGAVLSALGVTAGTVGTEAAPGVPWIFAEAGHPLALLLKSGNFGDPNLLVTASGAQKGSAHE